MILAPRPRRGSLRPRKLDVVGKQIRGESSLYWEHTRLGGLGTGVVTRPSLRSPPNRRPKMVVSSTQTNYRLDATRVVPSGAYTLCVRVLPVFLVFVTLANTLSTG